METNNNPKAIILVIAGPSGVGKSVLIKKLKQEFAPHELHFSVSHTTRGPRPGDIDGVDYHFVDRDAFIKLAEDGHLLEHEEVHGNLYGTSLHPIEEAVENSRFVILDLDVRGAESVRNYVKSLDWNHFDVFISPPSIEELDRRLAGRLSETPEAHAIRIKNAIAEIERADEFAAHIVNDDLERSYLEMRQAILDYEAKLQG